MYKCRSIALEIKSIMTLYCNNEDFMSPHQALCSSLFSISVLACFPRELCWLVDQIRKIVNIKNFQKQINFLGSWRLVHSNLQIKINHWGTLPFSFHFLRIIIVSQQQSA